MPKKKTKKRITKATQAKSGKKVKKVVGSARGQRSFVRLMIKQWGVRVGILLLVCLIGFTAYLDINIRTQFEGQKWALPAHVYTRPMELYVGQKIDRDLLEAELDELGYQDRAVVDRVGTFNFTDTQLDIYQREFRFWDRLREAQLLSIKFRGNTITRILSGGVDTEIVRLEPRLFGSASPLSHEDRSLLKLEDVPPALIDALIAIEDRQFYSHFGINPVGIARAMFRNVTAGRVVQGGSTLTQQLVKNYYLNSERTIRRKVTEVIMAMLLELHYSKDEILQAYLNEVYLSQAGNRAIHGFSLGSQYFFGRPLQELELPQLATLAGIIKGPSYYNPIKNPQRAKERRNLVLKTMLDQGSISDEQYTDAVAKGMGTSRNAARFAPLSYPAFMGFIRENLKNDYQQEDLLNDGLQIYTTLNPRIQKILEYSIQQELASIEADKGLPAGSLQVAAVVIRTDNGEVAAVAGDRKASFSGFNRAIQAQRPVGSLLKPFVYLSALESPERYSLASPISDEPITVSQQGSPDWQPQNYDGQSHGSVMMIDALARSYNLATVRLGMDIGVPKVANTIRRLGYQQYFNELPSVLLGAVPMTVMDVAQMYLTLASGGFKTPIKGIRSVLTNDHLPLARYPLTVDQVVQPEINDLINYALQEVVRNGTAKTVLNGFRYDYGLAGKTGTTDDYRDSWFAGYSGNYLTVVWIGRDDNQPTGLTGASGAARVWSKIMRQIPMERLKLNYHADVIPQRIAYSLDPVRQDCSLSRQLPVVKASLPLENIPCAGRMKYDLNNEDENKHFEPRSKRKKRKPFWKRIFGGKGT